MRAGVALPPGGARLLFTPLWQKLTFVVAEVPLPALLLPLLPVVASETCPAFGDGVGSVGLSSVQSGPGTNRGPGQQGVEERHRAPLGQRVVGVAALR